MVKCRDCKSEMVYKPLNKDEIILVCPNINCGFQSSPIKIYSEFASVEVIQSPERITRNEESGKEEIQNENVIADTQTILSRVGKINESFIFCLDFSTRMDIDIPYNKEYLISWENKILKDEVLSDHVKNTLIELLKPPISYFGAALFIFSNLILENIKKMTFKDFQSFQIISLTGKSEEVFRFPTFIENTNSEMIINFINSLNIIRQEYRSNNELEYRDYYSAINNISELLIELRETYPQEEIKIFLLTIGTNKTKTNLYHNSIREIKAKMEDLGPFSFNIINFDGFGLERSFKLITRRFSGQYSRESSFKGMINAILYNQFGTDPYVESKEIQTLELPKKFPAIPIEKPHKFEVPQNSPSKVEIEEYNFKDKNVDIDIKEDIPIVLLRKADNIIEKLKKQLE